MMRKRITIDLADYDEVEIGVVNRKRDAGPARGRSVAGTDPVLAAWVAACVSEAEAGAYKSDDAYARCCEWALAAGHKRSALPATSSGFTRKLKAAADFVENEHRRDGNWIVGLRINEPA